MSSPKEIYSIYYLSDLMLNGENNINFKAVKKNLNFFLTTNYSFLSI